jgi:hypothetical protein
MARAKKAKVEEVNSAVSSFTESTAPEAATAPKKRGRPKGSKNGPPQAKPTKKGRAGRPKGSKNKPKPATVGKRRGRPKGTSKGEVSLREIVVKIVREEVQNALHDAFKNL